MVMGAQFGLTPEDLQMNNVAPGRYFVANQPEQMQALMQGIQADMADSCQPMVDPLRPAWPRN